MAHLLESFYRWADLGASVLLPIDIFILLPLSVFRRLRPWTGAVIVASSFLFGLLWWMWSAVAVYQLWGLYWLLVGVLFAGVGVVPLAFFALLFHGDWAGLGGFWAMAASTIAARLGGMWIMSRGPSEGERSSESELHAQYKALGLPPPSEDDK